MAPKREQDPAKHTGTRKSVIDESEGGAEPFLDKFRTITSPRLEALSEALLEGYRGHADAGRQRQRRPQDAAAIRAIIDTILANLTYQFLATGSPQTPIVVPMRKPMAAQTRYDRKDFRKLQDIVKGLYAARWIGFQSGHLGKASTIWANPKLARRIADAEPTYRDLKRLPTETIILTRKAWTFRDVRQADGSKATRRGKQSDRVDYTDTKGPSGTIAARRRLGALSAWLTTADLRFAKPDHRIDTTSVTLTRRFTLTEGQTARGFKWNQNGRLQDGWWMGVPSEDRRHILINGEHVADLDYSAMFIRLGCLKAGIVLDPEVDPYDLPGMNRDGVKKVMLAMLFADNPRTKVPREAASMLPPKTTMRMMREAIAEHRPEVLPIFEKGWGLELMHRESEVMMALLEGVRAAGIVALPMHDGVMVQRSLAPAAAKFMAGVSREMVGTALPVKRKKVKGLDD